MDKVTAGLEFTPEEARFLLEVIRTQGMGFSIERTAVASAVYEKLKVFEPPKKE